MKKLFSFLLITVVFLSSLLAQSFRKEPYLIMQPDNQHEMMVIWQLTSTSSCTLEWGTTTSYGSSQSVSEYGSDHQFKYTITGLSPNTQYYYKVSFGSTNYTASFYTAPDAFATSVKFFAYGDTRSYPADQESVVSRMYNELSGTPDLQTFCIHSGDWVNFGRVESEWDDQFFNTSSSYSSMRAFRGRIPLTGVRGNHENYDASYDKAYADVFYKYFPYTFASGSTNGDDMYYSFDYGPVHIAVVDQYDDNPSYSSLGATQLSWLSNDLANSDKPWKFIVVHEPGWSASSTSKEHDNNSDVQNNIQPLCVQYGVQAVFGGHNHYYAHCLVNNVHHFTLGGGGAPPYDPSYTSGGVIVKAEKTYHYMKIEIDGNSAVLTVIKPDGTVVETINLTIPILAPTNLVATGVSTDEIDLTWSQNTDNDDILLAYNTSNTFGTPSGTYSNGDNITGGGQVIALGDLESFNHTGLSGQTYYYKIWSFNGTDYSDGVTASASPIVGEPTNHVTSFTAQNPSATSIELTWTDATGTVQPTGYLIKANLAGNAITSPSDGTPENDGTFTKNVAYGVQTLTFGGLSASTAYDFKIFPYTNAGVNIDYKTDGTIPSTTGTTTAPSATPTCEDFDTGVPTSYTSGTFTLSTGDWSGVSIYSESASASHGGSGHAVRINDDTPNANLTTPELNTVGNVTFWYRALNSDAGTFKLQKSYDNSAWTDIVSQSFSAQTFTEFSFDVDDNASSIYIRILSDDNPGHLIIDDFCWTASGSAPANDVTSVVVAPAGGQVAATTINSDQTDCNNPVDVFKFDINDAGTADGNATIVTNIRIKPATSNTADWTNTIQNIKVTKGTTDVTTSAITITDNYIDIPITAGNLNIADNSTEEITLSLCLNSSNIQDGDVLSFMIDADNHGFMADAAGSQFNPAFAADVISNDFTISVIIGIDEVSRTFNVIPNPASDFIDVWVDKDVNISKISIYSVSGQLVFTENTNDRIDISNLSSGIYFIEVNTQNTVLRQKMIKK